LNYSEAGKSAILTEALKNNYALNIGGIPDSLITKEKQLEKSIWNYEELIYEENKKKTPNQNKLKYWNEYLFEKKQEYDQLMNYLESNFVKYHALKHIQNEVKVEEIQKTLTRKDVLIEYFFTNDKIYSFLIKKDDLDIIVLNIDETFHSNLDHILFSLSNNNFSNHGYDDFKKYQESSLFLYNTLLKPIENEIKHKNLIIIPDGKLAYLPFEVLTTKDMQFKRINYKELPYLLYNHDINYSYSVSFLFENKRKVESVLKTIGAFAPTYDNISGLPEEFSSFRQEYREKLFPLKGIKIEVQEISKLLGGDQYLDEDAIEKTFKKVAPNYDILHLAMHTILDDVNPMYSKMAFTQNSDTTEDGFLNTYELYNIRLNSRMAVLSSCNSGSGKMHRGEGVMSLARGFIYSGCPSIVMTLWSVEDKSGVKLMTSFYKYLLKGKSKSESLTLSKLDFINTADQLKSHPYFWSGYVVIGNNKALFKTHRIYLVYFGIIILLLAGVLFLIKNKKSISTSSK
ncbi:CHAT domain-containing protein, partial [Bacteroidota bacterium]